MIKINTFSMAFSKTCCLFHFQTNFFLLIFSYGQYLAPEKMQFACKYFLGLFLWNLNILKKLKKPLMESIIDSVKSLDKITVHNPFFLIYTPFFYLFAPKKLHFALTHLQSLHFFTVGTI